MCAIHGFYVRLLGYFMYIEASLMRPGHKARLLTSDLRGSSSPQCLVFYYHMYGSGTGILSVLLRQGAGDSDTVLWRKRGEQTISWTRAMVDYHCDVRHQVPTNISMKLLHILINTKQHLVSSLVETTIHRHHLFI